MSEKIIDRLFLYLKQKGVPHTRFEKEIGLSNGYLKIQEKRRSDLGESVITKIIDYCIDMNVEWLLTGQGSMLRESSVKIVSEPIAEYNSRTSMQEVADLSATVNTLLNIIKDKDRKIEELLREIGGLKSEIDFMKGTGAGEEEMGAEDASCAAVG